MRKNYFRLIFIIFLIFSSFFHLSAQSGKSEKKIRIAVFSIENLTSHAELDNTAENIMTILRQSLMLAGNFEITAASGEESRRDNYYLKQYCSRTDTDYVLVGSLKRYSREVLTEIAVFSRDAGSIILTNKSESLTPIALRNSLRIITADTISYFTEEPVYFTSLTFNNMSRYSGDYYVYIDGNFFGKNIEHIEYLMSGERYIYIEQKRIFGKYILADITEYFTPRDRVSIEFSIPGFLEKEESKLSMHEDSINNNFNDIYRSQKTAGAFERAFKLIGDASYSSLAFEKKIELTLKYAEWQELKKEWNTGRGLTAADLPVSAGLKLISTSSSYNIGSWEPAGADPEAKSGFSYGGGAFTSLALTRFAGLQGEFLIYNQKTKVDYPDGYLPENYGSIAYSCSYMEAPLMLYLRIPEYLLKVYGGFSLKYRVTVMNIETEDLLTGEVSQSSYSEELLRMGNSSWLAGMSLEMPYYDNIFFLDFRYNRDLKSWFRSAAPEKDFIAAYLSISTGFAVKAGR